MNREVAEIENSSGAEADKFERFGLTIQPAGDIRAPLLTECIYLARWHGKKRQPADDGTERTALEEPQPAKPCGIGSHNACAQESGLEHGREFCPALDQHQFPPR